MRGRGRLYRAAAFALLAFTAVVLASATFRLDLYQRAYGWSELRFYAFAAIAFLAGALVIFALGVARGRMAFVIPPLAAAVVLVAVAVNAIGPSGFVARANLQRVTDPSGLPDDAQRTLDIGTLASLGDGAIPDLVARLDDLPTKERIAVGDLLRTTLQLAQCRRRGGLARVEPRSRACAPRAADVARRSARRTPRPALAAEQLREDRIALLGRRADLIPGAFLRVLVGPETQEPRAVADALVFHLVVSDLAHE